MSAIAPALPIQAPEITLSELADALALQLRRLAEGPLLVVGHSYAGMLLPQLAIELVDRITALVYLDAFVPLQGESAFDLLGPFGEELRSIARANAGMIPSPSPAQLGIVDPAQSAEVAHRLVPMPASTHESAATECALAPALPRSLYVRCAGFPGFEHQETRAREAGWDVDRLPAGHDAMLVDPSGVAAVILKVLQEQ